MERDAFDALVSYDWPGNVRELRNALEYAFALGEGEVLRLSELPPELRGEAPVDKRRVPSSAAAIEREQLLDALRRAHGRRAEAAALLGMSRSTLWRKLKEHRL